MMGRGQPRLLVIAGPNGAGKTTVTERGLAHIWFDGCEYLNPDLIARDLFGSWDDGAAVLKAAQWAEQRRRACLEEGRSLAFETVFSAPDKVEFVREAKERGYFCRLFFVGTASPTINAARVARRVMQGGHDVPISKIISRYATSLAQCATIAAEVDRLYLYDNSMDERDPRLVLRAANGQLVKTYGDLPDWVAPVVSRLIGAAPR